MVGSPRGNSRVWVVVVGHCDGAHFACATSRSECDRQLPAVTARDDELSRSGARRWTLALRQIRDAVCFRFGRPAAPMALVPRVGDLGGAGSVAGRTGQSTFDIAGWTMSEPGVSHILTAPSRDGHGSRF